MGLAPTLQLPCPHGLPGGGLQTPYVTEYTERSLAQHPLSITAPIAAALLNPPSIQQATWDTPQEFGNDVGTHPSHPVTIGCLCPCCRLWLMGGAVLGLGREHQWTWRHDTHWTLM